LSSKQPRKKPAAKAAPKAAKEAPARPSGKAPEAIVSSRRGTDMVSRQGRGFSKGELAGAGLVPRLATQWGLRVDPRRRSVLGGNVESLKGWAGHLASPRKHEGRARKVEEEIVKVEKEVEKEVGEVKEEALRAEREVKKEAVKAEKAVKAKVSRPKPKAKKKKPEA
jgi:ribosomal protein L13E